ncbi:uncharacterized protein SPSK_02031 [Sporothrix schenckii 1099-18]|uniref:Uncharacterized protein n=1 Tax=Sporothrix schenckii 1099-18 TaxID=1397361 RepID=A0A0F2MG22_SPOSC|nr:uncharacterized protein SPSK_02031 [Sporothrix schenckii 1099-18]KJR87111.1 hypothetical protein SPSK_02031 [Sporothrix schenckii 1099-18]
MHHPPSVSGQSHALIRSCSWLHPAFHLSLLFVPFRQAVPLYRMGPKWLLPLSLPKKSRHGVIWLSVEAWKQVFAPTALAYHARPLALSHRRLVRAPLCLPSHTPLPLITLLPPSFALPPLPIRRFRRSAVPFFSLASSNPFPDV